MIPLYFWRPKTFTNFGDELSRLIVQKMVEHDVQMTHDATVSPKLLACGSILQSARNGDVVWGSGFKTHELQPPSRLDVRAVRGPLTRQILMWHGLDCPEIYGDPALLLPRLFPELAGLPKHGTVIVPHYNELSHYKGQDNVVSVKDNPLGVVERIASSQYVLSGSLHGLIVADAFGVPCRLLHTRESLWKYLDYLASVGRKQIQPVSSDEAMALPPLPPPTLPDLDALMAAFPGELLR